MGHQDRVETVAFSPNGQTLASASDDGAVRLWDVRGHRALGAPLRGRKGAVLGVAFSPDGRTLASGGDDGTVRLWGGILWTDLADLRSEVCRLVVGNLTKSDGASLPPASRIPPHARPRSRLPTGNVDAKLDSACASVVR